MEVAMANGTSQSVIENILNTPALWNPTCTIVKALGFPCSRENVWFMTVWLGTVLLMLICTGLVLGAASIVNRRNRRQKG